jgi:hypothetical protein
VKIKVLPFSKEHYEEVKSWWEFHHWTPTPLSHLPTYGFVSFCDDLPAAAGWLYRTDSAFCWLDYIVANPKVRREARSLAINAMVDAATSEARNMGYRSMFMTAKSAPLIERMRKRGFIEAENGMTNLILKLGVPNGKTAE